MTSDGTMADSKPDDDAAAAPQAPNAFDSWLRRELRAVCDTAGHDTLPPEIAKLAARLEDRLRNADDDEAGNDTTREVHPDDDRIPARRGKKR